MLRALLQNDRMLVLAGLLAVILLAWGWLLLGAGIEMEQMDMGGGQVMLMAPEMFRQLRSSDFPNVGYHDDGDDVAQRRTSYPAGRRLDAPARRQPHLRANRTVRRGIFRPCGRI